MSAPAAVRAGCALDAALALARTPRLALRMRARPLPDDVIDVLRLLAGDAEAMERARDFARPLGGVRRRDLLAACELYVQQVVLHPQACPWRALGLAPGADRTLARDHFRLLMLWLHPDRAGAGWREPFARRVIDAWTVVAREDGEGRDGGVHARPPAPGSAANLMKWVRRPLRLRRRRGRKADAPKAGRAFVGAIVRRVFPAFALRWMSPPSSPRSEDPA